jgi:hypothetical protein
LFCDVIFYVCGGEAASSIAGQSRQKTAENTRRYCILKSKIIILLIF